MSRWFYPIILVATLLSFTAPAMAADVPDAVQNTFREIASFVGDTEAVIAARIIGDVDTKTDILAAKPISELWMKDTVEVASDVHMQLSLDWLYDPLILLAQPVDWYGGIGLRGQRAEAAKTVTVLIGVGAVSANIDKDGIGWCVGIGFSYQN